MKFTKVLSSVSTFLFATSFYCVSFAQQAASSGEAPVQVAGNADPHAAAGAPAWINFVLIGGIILFMWLFVFRPQSKRAKEQKEFLSSLSPGLEVVTTGGVIGKITEVKDNVVSLDVGNSTIRVLKSAVSSKLSV